MPTLTLNPDKRIKLDRRVEYVVADVGNVTVGTGPGFLLKAGGTMQLGEAGATLYSPSGSTVTVVYSDEWSEERRAIERATGTLIGDDLGNLAKEAQATHVTPA